MRTAWGYDVNGSLDPIVSESDFNRITGGVYSENQHVSSALAAASQAIRNYCGWHITPSMDCTAYPAGGTYMMRLPAGYVSAIDTITEDGTAVASTDYEWKRSGLIRRKDRFWSDTWDGIEVEYTAGYEDDAVPDLTEAVISIASGVLAVSAGVSQESADGVSITYSANATSVATALTSNYKSALEPYRVVNSHAT
ncbi:MAG: hypothetical protein Q4C03_01425 [bacterium]|nr:hypothetical protein [bacterium]